MAPEVLILRTAGTQCDEETAFAFRLAGARATRLHINILRKDPAVLSRFAILTIPGGFSYGDDLGAGTIEANEMVTLLRPALEEFIEAGKLVIGICNGFQVLVKTGLLPGLTRWEQQATLTVNDSGRFEDRWVHLKAPPNRCVLVEDGETLYTPVAHGEGKFVPAGADVLEALRAGGQIVWQYTDPQGRPAGYPWNPNGAVENIAAVCDPTGRILGMMPHPERHCLPTHHPRWTREGLKERGEGLAIFERAVRYAEANHTD
ncbi:MAG: phosphoribosylformylglycinamidine synthase I [Candidatus Brocadiia bacterium]|jgi:phosphoribosylformylglycinamidine synthase|nr:phosphoribosylformylglycinamidine synthase I [Candidatus Brocadiia bacterium]